MLQRIDLPLSVPEDHLEPVLKEHVVYGAELQMRSGIHYLAVGIRDVVAGSSGIARRGFRVGS